MNAKPGDDSTNEILRWQRPREVDQHGTSHRKIEQCSGYRARRIGRESSGGKEMQGAVHDDERGEGNGKPCQTSAPDCEKVPIVNRGNAIALMTTNDEVLTPAPSVACAQAGNPGPHHHSSPDGRGMQPAEGLPSEVRMLCLDAFKSPRADPSADTRARASWWSSDLVRPTTILPGCRNNLRGKFRVSPYCPLVPHHRFSWRTP